MYGFRERTLPGSSEQISFEIKRATGTQEEMYYVADGICYSTYSLETGSFLKIGNLNTDFKWEKDQKVFLEFSVGTNLGIRSGIIKIEKIGEDAPVGGWSNYPYFYKIEPQDEFKDGRVVKIRDGKRQLKCYALIGYLDNDENKNGTPNSSNSSSSSSNPVPVQILKENIILIPTVVSGVPCAIPFPYFKGGLTHLLSVKKDMSSSSSSSSSSSNQPSSSTS
jgi:hypothetical protein